VKKSLNVVHKKMPPRPIDIDILTQVTQNYTSKLSMVKPRISPKSLTFSVKDFAKIQKTSDSDEVKVTKNESVNDNFVPKTVNDIVQNSDCVDNLDNSNVFSDIKNNVMNTEVPITVTMDPLDTEHFDNEIEEPVSPPPCDPGAEPVIIEEHSKERGNGETSGDEISSYNGKISRNFTSHAVPRC
jgi:hypothetical protein